MKITPKPGSMLLVLFAWLVLGAHVVSQQPQSEAMSGLLC